MSSSSIVVVKSDSQLLKGRAAIRAKLTSLLWTPSCHLHQRTFKNYLLSFRKHIVRANKCRAVWDQKFARLQIIHCVIFQGPDKVSGGSFTLSTLLLWILFLLPCITLLSKKKWNWKATFPFLYHGVKSKQIFYYSSYIRTIGSDLS